MTNDFSQFDKGQPFYDTVGTFMVAICSCPAIFNADNPMNLEKSQIISITNGVHVPGKHALPLEVFEQAQAGHITLPTFLGNCCMMLANIAYENVKRRNDHSPEFELFRHVRNASSHGNRFFFTKNEPSRPAAWRTAVLDHMKTGNANPLQGAWCFGPFFGPADIIELLADIDKRWKGTSP